MTTSFFLLVVTIAIALAFDLINGFHDAANSIATVVSTRVLRPQIAVLWAASFNIVAMFIFAPKVANTIAGIVKVEANDPAYIAVALAGLLGAITWNILTWWLGLPSSSSHALIGGLTGAGIANGGWESIRWEKIWITVEFIAIAPFMGFVLGGILMLGACWLLRRARPAAVDHFFRKGQLLSAAAYSIGHGGNDAQKTMGIITMLLISAGILGPDVQLSLTDAKTLWIILSCHLAMGIGTAFGGWRIVKTMGMRLTKLKPVGGFCAEVAGAATLFFATATGVPVSTTHTITGAIIGVGSTTTKFSSVRWGLAGRIVWGWLFTIPAAAVISACSLKVLNIL